MANFGENTTLYRDSNGITYLKSYDTIIAFCVALKGYMTDKRYSKTTAKHKKAAAKEMPSCQIIPENKFRAKLAYCEGKTLRVIGETYFPEDTFKSIPRDWWIEAPLEIGIDFLKEKLGEKASIVKGLEGLIE